MKPFDELKLHQWSHLLYKKRRNYCFCINNKSALIGLAARWESGRGRQWVGLNGISVHNVITTLPHYHLIEFYLLICHVPCALTCTDLHPLSFCHQWRISCEQAVNSHDLSLQMDKSSPPAFPLLLLFITGSSSISPASRVKPGPDIYCVSSFLC